MKGSVGGENIDLGIGGPAGYTENTTPILTTSWQRFSVTYTPTATATGSIVVRDLSAAVRTFYVYGCMVTNGPATLPYVDGDSTGGSWNGAVGNSASTVIVAPVLSSTSSTGA